MKGVIIGDRGRGYAIQGVCQMCAGGGRDELGSCHIKTSGSGGVDRIWNSFIEREVAVRGCFCR